MALMKDELDRLNALACWDFEIERAGDGTLLILGSNDFDYYHDVEIEFHGVTFCDLPQTFSHAEFLLSPSACVDDDTDPKTVYVYGTSMIDMRKEFSLRARTVEVRERTVLYRPVSPS